MAEENIIYELPESVKKRLEREETPYIFSRNAQKSKVFNKPLLIIGLGGSGFEALSRAKEKMVSCFETNAKGELEGVEFLEIDTDARDRDNCLKEHNIGSLTENEFKIFQNADIGAILRNRDTNTDILPEEIDEWLDPNIPVAQIVHGAAGIRQAGRLLLHLNAIEIIDIIKYKLDKIRQSVILSKQPVNVVIFTGIGGGTGSGIFVDISYIVRECIKEFSGQAFITGIMLMPDILSGDPKVDKYTKMNIKRNGFAALKELDHLMNMSETHDFFTQRFPGGFIVNETNEAIFDRCVLVSSMVEGRLLLPRAKEHAYNIAAEMLIDMVSNSTIVSKGSNDVSRRDIALTNMKNRKPANYVYTAVGGQAVYFDFDLVFNLFIKNVLEYDLDISHEEVENCIDKILNERKFKEYIENMINKRDCFNTSSRNLYKLADENTDFVAPADCDLSYIRKKYKRDFEPVIDSENMTKYKVELRMFEHMRDELNEQLQGIYAEIKNPNVAIIDSMKNRIQTILTNTKEINDLRREDSELYKYTEQLKSLREEERQKRKNKFGHNIRTLFSKTKDMDQPKIALRKISDEQADRIKIDTYNRMIDDVINDTGKVFISKDEEDTKQKAEKLGGFYYSARSIWKDILKAKYDIEKQSGSEVEAIWSKYDGVFGESSIISSTNLKRDYCFKDIDFKSVKVNQYIQTIDKLIRDKYAIIVNEAAKEYKKRMTDNTLTELYQGETGILPDISTGQIFESYFEDVKISLDEVIMNIFEIKKPELKYVWREVIQSIMNNSDVLFSKKAMKDGEVFNRPGYNEIMIPDGNKMLSDVCMELNGQEAEVSDIRHRISCMRYTQCHKIDDYIYIDELESAYNLSNSKCGLHLRENGMDKWAKLPSPVYRNMHADYQFMDRYEDAKAALRYRYVFTLALKERIISYDQDEKKMFIDEKILRERLKDTTFSHISSQGGKVYLCNMEYNESKDFSSYFEYCIDWFIKMVEHRNLVSNALGINISDISDEDLKTMVENLDYKIIEKDKLDSI